jgi:hypothetical protein
MDGPVERWMRKPLQYLYADGFLELAVGLLFLISAGLVSLFAVALGRPPLAWAVGSLAVLLAAGLGLLAKRVVESAKERVTYPRTGFVEVRPDAGTGWTRWLVIELALALAVASLFLPSRFQQTGFALGALLTLILIVFGIRTGLLRFYLLAAATAGLTLAAGQWATGEPAGVAIVMGGAGLLLVTSGGLMLVRYLRSHPGEPANG